MNRRLVQNANDIQQGNINERIILVQITKIIEKDFFQISKGLKDLGYKEEIFVLLLVLRLANKFLEIVLSGPLRTYVIIELFECIKNRPETIYAIRSIKRLTT